MLHNGEFWQKIAVGGVDVMKKKMLEMICYVRCTFPPPSSDTPNGGCLKIPSRHVSRHRKYCWSSVMAVFSMKISTGLIFLSSWEVRWVKGRDTFNTMTGRVRLSFCKGTLLLSLKIRLPIVHFVTHTAGNKMYDSSTKSSFIYLFSPQFIQ